MRANDSFHIAVLAGDGIGPEVMAPALAVLKQVEAATPNLNFRFTEAPVGAEHYRATGTALPDSTIKLCEQADAMRSCSAPAAYRPSAIPTAPRSRRR